MFDKNFQMQFSILDWINTRFSVAPEATGKKMEVYCEGQPKQRYRENFNTLQAHTELYCLTLSYIIIDITKKKL